MQAQVHFSGQVFGRRADGRTEPLPFAQVFHMEKGNLIETDADGRFSATLPEGATLVATYVGYSRDTLRVSAASPTGNFYLIGDNDLEGSVVTARREGISRLNPVRTEVITAAGLCKMACCALAESFENSASVTVGYSDAISGARQIKLLGLSGIYTQMLDENRPVMRGLSNPFGLSYIPGQWLESIQIAKGPSSVVNGLEAITGQINVEHRKPTDETPLFINLYGSTDSMYEANVVSALQFNERWSTVFLAHAGGTVRSEDMNGDGFRDSPEELQFNFANRWLYYAPSGLQLRFGLRYINDDRTGGQMAFNKSMKEPHKDRIWGSVIENRGWNAYFKAGLPLNEENTANIALVADYNHHEIDDMSGLKDFAGRQNSFFANLIYQNQPGEMHRFEAGITAKYDDFSELMSPVENALVDWASPVVVTLETGTPYVPGIAHFTMPVDLSRKEASAALFGEYYLTLGEKLTFVGGLNLEYNNLHKWLFAPRMNLKYAPAEQVVFRLIGGRGFRSSNLFTDNLALFSTSRTLMIDKGLDLMEEAWTSGGNVTFYLPWGTEESSTYLSFDYFRNDFVRQVIADQECSDGYYNFYNLDGKSFTNTWQADFAIEPVERFTVNLTFRYTDAKVTLRNQGLVERPMTSRYKGVLNLQYATPMNIWTFDFTAQLNGPMKLYSFAAAKWGMEESPAYPMLYAQITRKFRGVDLYVGGENLTNYMQHHAILGAGDPFGTDFNASCIWGPLMGIKLYAGLRYTLWK